jgi:hypothetical protein
MRMWWLLMLPRDLLYDGCTYMDHCYGIMKTYRCIAMLLKISVYALCSDTRNFFVVYRILTYE